MMKRSRQKQGAKEAGDLKTFVDRERAQREKSKLSFDGSTEVDRVCNLPAPVNDFQKFTGKELKALFDDMSTSVDGSSTLASTVRFDITPQDRSALTSALLDSSLPLLKEVLYWVSHEDGRLPVLAHCNKEKKSPEIVNLTRSQVNGQLYLKAATYREFQVSSTGGPDAVRKVTWELVLEPFHLANYFYTFAVEAEDTVFVSDLELEHQEQERLLTSKMTDAEVAVLLVQEIRQLNETHASAMMRFMIKKRELDEKLEKLKTLGMVRDLLVLSKIDEALKNLGLGSGVSPPPTLPTS